MIMPIISINFYPYPEEENLHISFTILIAFTELRVHMSFYTATYCWS